MRELNMKSETIKTKSINEIRNIINLHGTEKWKINMETKTTLMRYRNEKINICEEKWYRNGAKYTIIMKARSNTLESECISWTMGN